MECASLKNWHFFGMGETNFPDWSYMVYTQVTDIPVGSAYWENLKKESLILDTRK